MSFVALDLVFLLHGLGFLPNSVGFFPVLRTALGCLPKKPQAREGSKPRSKNDSAGLAGAVKKNTSAKNSKNSAVDKDYLRTCSRFD